MSNALQSINFCPPSQPYLAYFNKHLVRKNDKYFLPLKWNVQTQIIKDKKEITYITNSHKKLWCVIEDIHIDEDYYLDRTYYIRGDPKYDYFLSEYKKIKMEKIDK